LSIIIFAQFSYARVRMLESKRPSTPPRYRFLIETRDCRALVRCNLQTVVLAAICVSKQTKSHAAADATTLLTWQPLLSVT